MGPTDRRLASRSRPVSCYFCRSRKLRCSRQSPCSNCLSRGIPCTLQVPALSSRTGITAIHPHMRPDESPSNTELLTRIRQLEEIVLLQRCGCHSRQQQLQHHIRQHLPPTQPNSRQTASSPSVDETSTQTEADVLQKAEFNHALLVSILPVPLSQKSIGPLNLSFRVCSIRYIPESPSYLWPSDARRQTVQEPVRCIWLPRHEEAKLLFEKYVRDITYIHHVIHTPTARALLDDIYDKLARDQQVPHAQVALLLSIFAGTTYAWTSLDTTSHPELFRQTEEANTQSPLWIRACLDLVDHSRRCASRSMEDIQAIIISFFTLVNLEGITLRYSSLVNQAISMARDLGFHRLDHPNHASSSGRPKPGSIAEEIARRIWWYLSATDWMLCRYASPQEGTYSVHPRHTITRKPMNANDEDLYDGMCTSIGKPISEATEMSYFLQRIRLGELCRELCDRIPLDTMPGEPAGHTQVLEIDAKFNEFIAGIPEFFRLDRDNAQEPRRKLTTGIIIQRYILNSLLHSHCCKMHLPYLASRDAVDPQYAYSRKVCLDAARQIICTERLLEQEDVVFVRTRFRISGVLQAVFIASIVFLLDMCFHNDRGQCDPNRKVELLDACSILEDARTQSPMIAGLLESLNGVVQKYKLCLPLLTNIPRPSLDLASGPDTPSIGTKVANLTADKLTSSSTTISSSGETGSTIEAPAINIEMPFFDWDSFSADMEIDSLDWNAMLSELDSQYFVNTMPGV